MGRNHGQARKPGNAYRPNSGVSKTTRIRTIKLFPEPLQNALVKIGCSSLQKLWRTYSKSAGQRRIDGLLERHVTLPHVDGQPPKTDYTLVAQIRTYLTTRRLPPEAISRPSSIPPSVPLATAAE